MFREYRNSASPPTYPVKPENAAAFITLQNLLFPKTPAKASFEDVKTLRTHHTCKRCVVVERYRFYRRDKRQGEGISDFVVELKKMAATGTTSLWDYTMTPSAESSSRRKTGTSPSKRLTAQRWGWKQRKEMRSNDVYWQRNVPPNKMCNLIGQLSLKTIIPVTHTQKLPVAMLPTKSRLDAAPVSDGRGAG
ncbi:hypothetical protein HPB49_010656 [Dermacentor silvarum]|uniref:Uncharacterized protein n=1 Tax=Dermacentor silvarum TaxID=543639 RepID=A0ACB8D4Q4_DERSI|nr:hypothetical protein HPB49_010656 [Dermacentor silvarum]